MSDIEGKVAREAMSECGQRASFNGRPRVSATASHDRELLLVQSSIVEAVCSWTSVKFPFRTGEQWGFYLIPHPVVTVTGKAFYDIDHSGKDPRTNRRNYDSSLAVWEIHPVMKLVQNGP